jgi:opacity protein-like surface antigen
VAVALAGFGIDRVYADDWHFDPRVDLSGVYNSNYGLESGNVENVSVAGSVLDAALDVNVLDPTTKFEITPRVRTLNFPGESEFNANDFYLNSQFQQLWQRAKFTLNEFFWSQDILQSYLPSTNIGVPLGQNSPGADLATVSQRVRQNLLLLTPTATFDLSAREQLQAQVQYLGIDYSQEIYNEVQNFKNFSGSLGLASTISAQSSVTVRGTAADLDPAVGSAAHTYGAEGEWDTHLSERMQAYAKLGVEHTSFELAEYGKSSATSVSGGLGISRKFVGYDLFADFSRSISPDSAGAVVARNDLRLRLEHKFSERTSGYLGLRGIDQEALGNSVSFTSQRYGQAAIGVEWRMFRQFSIISEYAYTNLKEGDALPAGSNAVTITLRYQPHRPAQEIGVDIGRY